MSQTENEERVVAKEEGRNIPVVESFSRKPRHTRKRSPYRRKTSGQIFKQCIRLAREIRNKKEEESI